MKRTGWTAILLAALLLLLTAAQAKGPAKAAHQPSRTDSPNRTESVREKSAVRKIPILPLLPLEEDTTLLTPQPLSEPWHTKEPSLPALPLAEDELEPESQPQSSGAASGRESPPAPPTQSKPVKSAALSGDEPEGRSDLRFPYAEDWQLLLVNPWNELPENYEVTLKALPDGMKVDERAYDDLSAMLQACRDEGLRPKICSAYRTMSKQTYLYNNKIARLRNAGYSKKAAQAEAGRWVARPGTSEHQLGLAVDIVSSSYQGLTKKQEKTAEQKWLMEHCWEYGFILRYPNDKSEITGIGYEPWHYRYVGVDVAMDMRDSGLCLEEYLLLREESPEDSNWI